MTTCTGLLADRQSVLAEGDLARQAPECDIFDATQTHGCGDHRVIEVEARFAASMKDPDYYAASEAWFSHVVDGESRDYVLSEVVE